MTEFTLRQLQTEQVPWVAHNFGGRRAWQPLLGLGEELGEYLEAVNIALLRHDAIADMTIYLADYCSAMGWVIPEADEAPDTIQHPGICIGRLMHHHLKAQQGIRGSVEHHEAEGRRWVQELINSLSCRTGHEPYMAIVERTWAKVKARDWRADPDKGGQAKAVRAD